MNLSEKRRAESMIKDIFNGAESLSKLDASPKPSAALARKAAQLQRDLDDLLAAAHFERDSRGGLRPTNTHPEYVKARADKDARRQELHSQRDALILRLWADDLAWDEIERVRKAPK